LACLVVRRGTKGKNLLNCPYRSFARKKGLRSERLRSSTTTGERALREEETESPRGFRIRKNQRKKNLITSTGEGGKLVSIRGETYPAPFRRARTGGNDGIVRKKLSSSSLMDESSLKIGEKKNTPRGTKTWRYTTLHSVIVLECRKKEIY